LAPPVVFPSAEGGPRAPKRLSWGPVKVFNDLAMAAPLTRETQAGPRRPFLSTRLGVVALSVAVVLAGSVVLVAVKTSAPRVGVIEVAAELRGNATDAEVGSLAAAPLRLPHCAGFHFQRSPLRLQAWGEPLDERVATVVLVHYGGGWSLSGGGDNTAVFLLRQGEKARVMGALSSAFALYELAPGAPQPVVPLAANLTGPHSLDARYVVNGTLDLWPQFSVAEGNFLVEEFHNAEAFGGVEVVNRGPLFCA